MSVSRDLYRAINNEVLTAFRKVYIIMHRRADLDAFMSSYVLGRILTEIHELDCMYLAPEGVSDRVMNVVSQDIIDKMLFTEDVDEDSLLIFIDVGAEATLSTHRDLLEKTNVKWLIDHHESIENFTNRFNRVFLDPSYTSTLEIILGMFLEGLLEIDIGEFFNSKELSLLIATIIVETRFMQLANVNTLRALENLLKVFGRDVRLVNFYGLLAKKADISEKIAVLKGFKRLKLYRCGDYLLGISNVGAFQNILSSRLIGNGLDIAIIYSYDEDKCRIHIRINDDTAERLGVNVIEDIIKRLMERFGGSGGGHDKLGNIEFSKETCNEGIEKVLIYIMNIFSEKGYRFKLIN
jgi:nanoRNase/pAp phosphatase (c-di-AMP/oligoRNAs hydrolase)